MSAVHCPRCRAEHDGALDRRGWNQCPRCAHTWKPDDGAGAAAGSDEYLPSQAARSSPPAALSGGGGEPSPPGVLATVGAPATPAPDAAGTARSRRANAPVSATVAAVNDARASCPVCGHAFVLVGSPPSVYQTCPQCSTTFNTDNGLLAGGEDDPGPDGRDWLIGRTIRGCFIDRKIGEGGMGAVYHARQLSLDRSVAIKVMPAELARNRNFIQRFEREAKSLAKINHPNILHIYDFGEDHALGIYFMIIEFVDGKDLGEILRERQAISELEGLDIIRQALMGLEMAAEKGVIHRDIKPDNLMLSAAGVCKVSDFGLAKGYGTFDEVTSAGVRVGTPAFMSPEQCDGHEVDFRSDVYSLGCTAYLAFTGNLPFAGDSPFSIMLKHKTEAPPSMRIHRDAIDARVDQLVQRMLAKRPDDRCTSLHQLIDLVEQLQLSLGGSNGMLRKFGDRRGDSGAVRLLAEAAAPALLASEPAAPPPALPAVKDIDFLHAPSSRPAVAVPPPPAPPPSAAAPLPTPVPLPARPLAVAPGVAPAAWSPIPTPAPAARDARREPPRTGTTTAHLAALRKGPAKGVSGRLADARQQQRQSEAAAAEKRGDALLAMGQVAPAVREWQRALACKPAFAQHSALVAKVASAQRRLGRRRHARSVVLLAVFAALLVINGWLGTPVIHRLLSERDHAAISALPVESRAAALARFLERHAEPWSWYQRLYRRGYALPLAEQARRELGRATSAPPPPPVERPPVDAAGDAGVQRLRSLAADGGTPWAEVLAAAESALTGPLGEAARGEVAAVAAQARQALLAITQELAAMRDHRAAGDHGTALALARAFPGRHPRAGALADQVPLPVLAVATVAGSSLPVDALHLTVDGVALKPAASALPGEATLCRWRDREAEVRLAAPGFAEQVVRLPPGDDARTLRVALAHARRWRSELAMPGPWLELRARGDGSLLAAAAQGVAVLGLDDGRLRGRPLRRDGVNVADGARNSLWTQARPIAGDRVLMTTSDGLVLTLAVSAAAGVAFDALRMRGTMPLAAALERDAAFVAGRTACFAVQRHSDGAQLTVLVDGVPHGQPLALIGRQTAQLFALPVGVAVIDDRTLSLLDDHGQPLVRQPLAAPRSGPAVRAGGHLAVPTSAGLELIAFSQADAGVAARRLAATGLSRLPDPRLAGEGDDLLTAAGNEVTLHRCTETGAELAWSAALPAKRSAAAAVGLGALALVVDDQGTIHCLRRSDGIGVHRIGHGRLPALAPLAVAGSVIVLDADGTVTAYVLP